jgi:hypothetical protein
MLFPRRLRLSFNWKNLLRQPIGRKDSKHPLHIVIVPKISLSIKRLKRWTSTVWWMTSKVTTLRPIYSGRTVPLLSILKRKVKNFHIKYSNEVKSNSFLERIKLWEVGGLSSGRVRLFYQLAPGYIRDPLLLKSCQVKGTVSQKWIVLDGLKL